MTQVLTQELMMKPACLAGMVCSSIREETLAAVAVGTGLAIGMIDRSINVAGILHTLLPFAKGDVIRAQVRPGLFVDSGVETLLRKLKGHGARVDRLEIYVVGGSMILGATNELKIGQRNRQALETVLGKHSLKLTGEHVGDYINQSLFLPVGPERPWYEITGREGRFTL